MRKYLILKLLSLGLYAETPSVESSFLLDHTLPFVQQVKLENTHTYTCTSITVCKMLGIVQ